MKKLQTLSAIAAAAVLMTSTASAGITATDNFDTTGPYTTGASINGVNGGTGWGSGWTTVTNDPFTASGSNQITNAGNGRIERDLSSPFNLAPGNDLFIGFKMTLNNTSFTGLELGQGTIGASGNRRLRFYSEGGVFNLDAPDVGLATPETFGTATAGQTYDVALKWGGDGIVSVWLDNFNESAPTYTATHVFGTGTGITKYGLSNWDGSVTYGAMTTGTTFADVSVVPEPSTYALIAGVAVLGFAAYRRRKAVA